MPTGLFFLLLALFLKLSLSLGLRLPRSLRGCFLGLKPLTFLLFCNPCLSILRVREVDTCSSACPILVYLELGAIVDFYIHIFVLWKFGVKVAI